MMNGLRDFFLFAKNYKIDTKMKSKILFLVFVLILFIIIFGIKQIFYSKDEDNSINNNITKEMEESNAEKYEESETKTSGKMEDTKRREDIDVTIDVKRIITNSDNESLHADVIGACIDYENVLQVTVRRNNMAALVNNMIGLKNEKIVWSQMAEPFLNSVKNIYKKYPTIKNYKMCLVHFKDMIDSYGNKTGKDKIIEAIMSMSHETEEKVNWQYVKENLGSTIMYDSEDYSRIKNMLDEFTVNEE
jgi:hypothetical protein